MQEVKIPTWYEHHGKNFSQNTNPLDFLKLQLNCKHVILGD
jgi:hypothetical protein